MTHAKRALIVDDEAIVCDRLRPPLERAGLEVETFTDSSAAMARFREAPFDILVTDLKMRKPDGLDMLKLAREIAPRTHVFVITGFPTIDAAREAMKSGAVDFIPKPFKISQLREMIVEACRRQDEDDADGADG